MAPTVSISFYYFTLFAALGFYWPYFSLYLQSLGVRPAETTRLMSLGPLMGVLVPLGIALLADARRARVWLLRAGSLGAALAFAGFVPAGGARTAIYCTYLLFALCRAPLTALVDATAVEEARKHGLAYGQLRLWGSLGFLAAVAGGGALFQVSGYGVMIAATTAALLASAAAAWAIPAPPIMARRRVLRGWRAILATPDLWLFLVAVLLGQTACAAYDGCFSLHLHRLGFGDRFVGAAWATGVAAEIGLLGLSGRLIARFGAERLLAFSFATAAVRWALLGRVTSAFAILALQPLHGITFSCFYASGVMIMRARAQHETPTTAQGLYSACVSAGTVIGLSMAGRIFDRFGGAALFSVAGAVAAGAWLFALRFAGATERRALQSDRALVG